MALSKNTIKRIETFIQEETRDLDDDDYIEWLEEIEELASSSRQAKQEERANDDQR